MPGGLTATSRKYGAEHRALRNHWQARVQAGEVACARCGRWIPPNTRWHLGHDHRNGGYHGPEHARCNLRERNRRCNWKRRRKPKPSRVW
jgi:hypothetical protein